MSAGGADPAVVSGTRSPGRMAWRAAAGTWTVHDVDSGHGPTGYGEASGSPTVQPHFQMHGQFIWYELTTPDVAGAKAFYPRLTAWGTQAFDKDYTMWTTGGSPLAGIFRLTDEMKAQGVPPNWMPYVESRDVDETVKLAAASGGEVLHGPEEVPGVGRFAVVSDPQGAVFGVYKPAFSQAAWDGTPVVGRFSWHELMTTDRAAALRFYSKLFGWEALDEMDMGDGEMYAMWGHGKAMYGGMFDRPQQMAGMRPFWLVYINVKDVGKAVVAATRAGATVVRSQMDIPGGSIAILADPQGAGFALHHVSAPAPAATPTRKVTAKATSARSKSGKAAAGRQTKRVAGAVTRRKTKAPAKRIAKPAAKKAVARKTAAAGRSTRRPAKTKVRKTSAARPRKPAARNARRATSKRTRTAPRTKRRR